MATTDGWVRVTDRDTGHKRTIRESHLEHGNYTVLKADAIDKVSGEPLPPEFNAVKPATTTTDGQPATDTKEK